MPAGLPNTDTRPSPWWARPSSTPGPGHQTMREILRAGWASAAILAAVLGARAAEAGDFDKLASQLTRGAKAHGSRRVAVLPFQVIGGRGATSGRIVSERLLSPMLADGSVEVVERAMLETVMREQQLQYSGLVDARSVKAIGRILNVDAVVTGTVISLRDDRVEVNARLIDAENARILFAAEARVDRDWNESLFDDAAWSSLFPPLPSMEMTQAAAMGWECERTERSADDLERGLVDLKARFWAEKLREGLDGASLKRNPGSEIRNPEIRAEFYERLAERSSQAASPLSAEEREQLRQGLQQLRQLNDCRGEGS